MRFRRLIGGLLALTLPQMSGGAVHADPQETVVLLHGLGRTAVSMMLLGLRLEQAGYRVISNTYPSRDAAIEDHVAWLDAELDACCRGESKRVHFVTHSLGGIILRVYLDANAFPQLGRVVMLSPPNQGSEVVDIFREYDFFRASMGPSALQLGTDEESVPKSLGPVAFELGVITGNTTLDPISSYFIPGSDDGKVAVESAKVEGMKDFRVVPHSHTFIMNSPEVAEQVIAFLRTGAFLQRGDEVDEEE